MNVSTFGEKVGLAEMLKGGVIMDVTDADQARIAEDAGAAAVMALERIPADIRADGGIARMSDPKMIKEIQRHPVTYDILHVDFHRVSLTEEVTTRVPVELVGESIGVKEGGILEFLLRELEIRCLPTEIPEHIAIDISHMRIGDSLRVGDLKLKEGITVLDDPETVIVLIAAPVVREEIEEVEEAEEAEEEEKGE